MAHSKRLLTPAQSLYKAFCISPALPPHCRLLSQDRPSTQFGAPQQHSPALPFSRSRSSQLDPNVQKKLSGYTLNDDIDSRWVQVKNSDEKLDEPLMLHTLLSQIDLQSHAVRLLSPTGPTEDTAVVQVQSIEDLLKLAAGREQALKDLIKSRKDNKTKQLEINWAISENDLALKLKQLEQFLSQGRKVEVLLAARKRQRKASAEEAQVLIKKLQDKVEDAGSKQLKMEGNLLGQATLTFQSKDR